MKSANVKCEIRKCRCLRGCAHCGLGGSPSFGDGGFETRVESIKFVNSSERVLFR
jgi:hypothetical protein